MTLKTIQENVLSNLAEDLLSSREETYRFAPTNFDVYLASSGLQKCIRRGDRETALKCAARLIEDDPVRFWRRLSVVATEDIGVANFHLMSKVVAVAGRSQWRQAHGGQWKVAAHLVNGLCQSIKDRTADDIIVLCEHDPNLVDHRRSFSSAHIERLAEIVIDENVSIPARALAAWYGCGTARYRSSVLRERHGEPYLIFDAYLKSGIDECVIEICHFAARQSNYPLAIFVPLLLKAIKHSSSHSEEVKLLRIFLKELVTHFIITMTQS